MPKDNLKVNYARYKKFVVNNIAYYSQKPGIKAYLEILLSLLAIIILAIFALKPTLTAIAGLIKEIDSKKDIIATLDEKKANLDQAGKIYNQEKEKIELINQALPSAVKPDNSTRQLEGVFGANEVSLSRLGIGETALLGTNESNFGIGGQPIPNTGDLMVTFQAVGDYESLKKLTQDFQNLRRFLFINGYQIGREGEGSQSQIVLTVGGSFPFYNSSVQLK